MSLSIRIVRCFFVLLLVFISLTRCDIQPGLAARAAGQLFRCQDDKWWLWLFLVIVSQLWAPVLLSVGWQLTVLWSFAFIDRDMFHFWEQVRSDACHLKKNNNTQKKDSWYSETSLKPCFYSVCCFGENEYSCFHDYVTLGRVDVPVSMAVSCYFGDS